ncbi:MAG: cobalamin biosynthesis protein CobQ [Huintestinicola sp.]
MKKITVITGHYGSGKSSFAANYAVKCAAEGEKVTVVDMDTVNPYFRTADLGGLFSEHDIKLSAPMYANTNLDIPVLSFDLQGLAEEGRKLVIDMGGDDAGAYPLGKFKAYLESVSEEVDMLYVVNFCRYLTTEPEEALELMHDIERACGISATGIVNNSNLGRETTAELINSCLEKAESTAAAAGLPLFCTTVSEGVDISAVKAENILPMKTYIKNIWED